jgi:hypothetical protein
LKANCSEASLGQGRWEIKVAYKQEGGGGCFKNPNIDFQQNKKYVKSYNIVYWREDKRLH